MIISIQETTKRPSYERYRKSGKNLITKMSTSVTVNYVMYELLIFSEALHTISIASDYSYELYKSDTANLTWAGATIKSTGNNTANTFGARMIIMSTL